MSIRFAEIRLTDTATATRSATSGDVAEALGVRVGEAVGVILLIMAAALVLRFVVRKLRGGNRP